MQYTKTDVVFKSAGLQLKGWFYQPDDISQSAPCIIMAHGFTALKEHYLDPFARVFAQAGFCVLVYDNRQFGESEGLPSLEVDPAGQIADMREAIQFIQQHPQVDSARIGLWGTSFSSGVALVVAATDARAKCVVVQVPFVQGHHEALRKARPEKWLDLQKKYAADEAGRLAGQAPVMLAVVIDENNPSAIMKIPSAAEFFKSVSQWENKVTLKSMQNAGDFVPMQYLDQIRVPILFIVAEHDSINPTALALEAYGKISAPKKLVMIAGDHFAPYVEQFEICVSEAKKWFVMGS